MSRKFESADPLRRGARRPPASAVRAAAQRLARSKPNSDQESTPSPAAADLTQKQPPASMQNSGFQEFALKMCTKEDITGMRYHILKFHSKTPVDPANQFVPPIRLHRKDPRQLQLLAGQEEEGTGETPVGDASESAMDVDIKSADVSRTDIKTENSTFNVGGGGAPPNGTEAAGNTSTNTNGGTNQPAKRRPFGKRRKTRQIHGGEKNEAARKLRYEEHYPWVMEDFDNKNTWISSFEAAQSENHAVLTYDAASNGFKVIPIEKFYRMTAAARYATLSLEDAEERMESAHSMRDRWLMSHLQPRTSTAAGSAANMNSPFVDPSAPTAGFSGGRLRTVVGSEERHHKYNMDEEMDYNADEMFDDDEGAPILDGPEEDIKDVEERIKREQLKANELMDAGNDDDIDQLFDDEEAREGKQGRKLRKALRSLEKNQYYDTDDEENPYASSQDESDSDEEITNQTNNFSTNELGNPPIKREEDADAAGVVLPVVSQFRKKHINKDALPHGTIVLQLAPEVLGKFQPGVWNPNAKRETSVPVKEEVEDPRLLTREDVRRNIKSGETDIKQLLNALKPKLAQHKDNVPRLRQFVKEVARSKDRKLYLRN